MRVIRSLYFATVIEVVQPPVKRASRSRVVPRSVTRRSRPDTTGVPEP